MTGVQEVMGLIPVNFFFVPRSCHVDQYTFHKFCDNPLLSQEFAYKMSFTCKKRIKLPHFHVKV